jgi:hypothetical protein
MVDKWLHIDTPFFTKNNSHNIQKEGFHNYDYADDRAIIISGHFLTTLRDPMENALKTTYGCCKTRGLMINLLNTNIMVFTREYKPEPTQPLRLKGKEITFSGTVKYLGVLLDLKLNWKQHLTDKKKKL